MAKNHHVPPARPAADIGEGLIHTVIVAFGEDVHHHVLDHAGFEWAVFNASFTDWERRRHFERI